MLCSYPSFYDQTIVGNHHNQTSRPKISPKFAKPYKLKGLGCVPSLSLSLKLFLYRSIVVIFFAVNTIKLIDRFSIPQVKKILTRLRTIQAIIYFPERGSKFLLKSVVVW